MRTASPAKRTTPARKSAGKSQNNSDESKRTPITRAKLAKANEAIATAASSPVAVTPQSAAEGAKALEVDGGDVLDHAAQETQLVSRAKTARKLERKVVKKSPQCKNASVEASTTIGSGTENIEESLKEQEEELEVKEELQDEVVPEQDERDSVNLMPSDGFSGPVRKDQGDMDENVHPIMDMKTIEVATENAVITSNILETGCKDMETSGDHETAAGVVKPPDVKEPLFKDVKSAEHQEAVAKDANSLNELDSNNIKKEVQLNENLEGGQNVANDNIDVHGEVDRMEEDANEKMKGKNTYDEESDDDRIEAFREQDDHEELSGEEFAEGDAPQNGEDADAVAEETAELNAAANERRKRKELEIFVGGLHRDATEEDLRRVFQHAGEVVEVRMQRDLHTNKNKGYAFVKFGTKEQANRVLAEMRNPVIRGKRCATAPCEDDDTLFLGNICNTWTKEAIRQRLIEYGIEGVVNITLVKDPKHEGLSKGFAFIEFSCHADAVTAFKRLQKPDVVFGHTERTAKVAFAEPLSEPDPEVMAQVKSVFVDGLPPHWDEDRVRDKFKGFGEIAQIMLARNMSSAKRKDFGFVDFTTHEAAVACAEGIHNSELSDGNSKVKVRARLSNPLPKTQAVKGGIFGGFRIGRGGRGANTNNERGYARGGRAFGQLNFQRGRGFYPHGRGYGRRMGFAEHDFGIPYPPFTERQNFGGDRWSFRGAHSPSDVGPTYARPYLDRPRYLDHGLRRQPYPADEAFDRPFTGRHYEDPYFYDQMPHGMKRPLLRTDPDYMEPSGHRPRLDYSEPAVSFRGSYYRDDFAAADGFSSRDYGYDTDYHGGTYPSYHGDRPHRRGYYY